MEIFNWEPIITWLGGQGLRIFLILLFSGLFYWILKRFLPPLITTAITRGLKEEPEEAKKRAQTLSRALLFAGGIFIIFGALASILSELGINLAAVLAGFGIAGLAIGFGAQSLIRDIISGFFILIENQYRVGDVVRIADISGLVEDINLRRTVLRDLDGIVHYIPNGEVRIASNFTREFSRVNMNISVAYGEDLDKVISVINRVGKELAEDPYWGQFILNPPRVLRVDKFGESGIEIKILGDTKPIKQWDVMGELRLRLKKAFDKEGIEIPWPHTKVYFGNLPSWLKQGEKQPD